HCASWTNRKHAREWKASLATHALPEIGALPVPAIDTPLVLKVLEPIWTTKPETASRVRGRIESILDWAKVRGYRRALGPNINHEGARPHQRNFRADDPGRGPAHRSPDRVRTHRRLRLSLQLVRHALCGAARISRRMGMDDGAANHRAGE